MTLPFRGAACLALFLTGTAHAEWLPVARSDDGRVYSMDADRIRTVAGRVEVWVQVDYSRDRSVRYRRGLELWSFNCASQSMKVVSITNYDAYGHVVNSRSEPAYSSDVGFEPVVPDTIGETAFSVACPSATS